MAIHRGLQSAIFYYLSCAPCADRRYKKKLRQEAEHNRAARDALADEIPNFYRQPYPSTTNPWWQREIEAGPSYNPRPKRPLSPSQIGYKSRPSGDTSGVPSSVTLTSNKAPHSLSSQSKVASFQREDEQLWGSNASLSLPKPARAHVKNSPHTDFQSYRNPAVSDMHPAIATKVNSRDEILWMMQPPPVAEVMNGKERPSRSERGYPSPHLTPISRPTTRHSSRRISSKPEDDPISESLEDVMNPEPASTSDHNHLDTTSQHDFASISSEPRRHSSYAPPLQDSPISHSPESTFESLPTLSPTVSRRSAHRPRLPTIMSEAATPQIRSHELSLLPSPVFFQTSRENISPSFRHSSAIDVDPKSPRLITQRSAIIPSEQTGMFDSWYTDDVDLPKWIHEHTKREVRQRWSMDL